MAQQWIASRPGDLDVLSFTEVDTPPPGPGEVTIAVRAAGMNPADYKHVAGGEVADFPKPVGYEVAGTITAVGPDTEIVTGAVAEGDEVLAFRITGGWATEVTVPAKDVLHRPAEIGVEQAANLLLAGSTAAEMLHVTGARSGETVLVHGASGAVGVSVLQQARVAGVHAIGTASEANHDVVRRYGGVPVTYGEGLEQRVRDAAAERGWAGVDAALDCVGTDEAIDVSLALVAKERLVTIAAFARAEAEGIRAIAGRMPASQAYRDRIRPELVRLAREGHLEVPLARTYPLADALEAAAFLRGQHPGGKIALLP
ncbi:NADP-dependent oxidoreductase [Nocardioides sp. CFH 31398]|uniref:quinone oxidoreductase family protein n=1 Tax=Nocardioides sp. CFH 31398 TaxID=2919579 RepID=UPI001F05A60E|nr:NADP-dependent oxidoreductase [Nocardioides sp. CFH 31398]MCH1865368.1 NADP-dependent oxidoreductase [Nocardioides sp. CFH 31398]MCH1868752.1 NADP-dependent oxidoreductase [Nocardioides sp. CFH 31398]